MLKDLEKYLHKPELYTPEGENIWDDEHISKGMFDAHFDKNGEAASRSSVFMDKSAAWISEIAPPTEYEKLLDLGCGPGLYAERFQKLGYKVTGIDFSRRSITYATEQAEKSKSGINYIYMDYLKIDYHEKFDVVTLIYCDYAVMSKENRLKLLKLIHKALKPGGKLIFDVFTETKRSAEEQNWYFSEKSDFWCDEPHLCLNSIFQYEDDDKTELRRSVICTENSVRSFNVWDHFFTKNKLTEELTASSFFSIEFYADVSGKELISDTSSDTICAVADK